MYQVSVSLNGSFLFRTEWLSSTGNNTLTALQSIADCFGGGNYKVSLNYRSPYHYSDDITSGNNILHQMEQLVEISKK